MFWSRSEPVEFASFVTTLSLHTRPSAIACWSPRLAASLNDLSPRPPMSNATPTLMSELHSAAPVPPAAPPVALVPPPPLSSLPHSAATIDRTPTRISAFARHERMPSPSRSDGCPYQGHGRSFSAGGTSPSNEVCGPTEVRSGARPEMLRSAARPGGRWIVGGGESPDGPATGDPRAVRDFRSADRVHGGHARTGRAR